MTALDKIFFSITNEKKPTELYDPIHYILSQQGKRLRPQLVLLATQLFDGKEENALQVAASFEMLHNFTLIHDDIMDNASVRRGKPTVQKKWNNNIAILSGDALAIMALQQLLTINTDEFTRTKLITLFAQTALEICEGQQYDLNFETSHSVSIDDYFEMIRLKTAVMLAGCAKGGAIVANCSTQNADLLYQYGINLGMAFQLKDDLLDIYADYEIFGKAKGVDIQDNKKTYLYLRTLQDASEQDRATLLHLFSDSSISVDKKCEKTIQIYNQYHAKEKTEKVLKVFVDKALQNLEELTAVNQEIKEEFVILTNKLTDRDK